MVIQKEFGHLWELLSQIPDPEIPVINLVELGVIRKIEEKPDQDKVVITITPTYTGCPAKKLFNDLILEKLYENGYKNVELVSQLHPVWTTDWLTEETKAKLLKEGISPPTAENKIIQCPHCKSTDTRMISAFGSTPCQALYSCNKCLEPFNYFKCH
ncbi:MAG: phenylacetate-CoA oxygenase subunit PaaJ [Bacteroidetes bacterium]|nr:phenylacetate-CoA oxygenase subunit PaaJ [Bacteroidota bacterium]